MAEKQKQQIVLLDNDDFYGMTVDLVLFNFGLENCEQVTTRNEFENFQKRLSQGKYDSAVYLLDELFAMGKIDLEKLAEDIRNQDKKAKIVLYSAVKPDEVPKNKAFDKVILKSGKSNELSLIKTLSELLGLEFIADNSDPESENVKR